MVMVTPGYYGSLWTGPAQSCPCDSLRVSPVGLLEFLEFGLYSSGPQLPIGDQFIAASYSLFRETAFQSVGLDGSNRRETCKIARSFPIPVFIFLSLNLFGSRCMTDLQECVLGQGGIRTWEL